MLFITSLMVKAVIGISLRTTVGSSADIRTLVIKTDFSEGVLESTNQLSWRTQQRSLNPPLCHQRLIYQRWRRPRRLVDLRGEIFRQERTFRQTSFRMAQINGFTGVSSFGRLLIVYRRTGIQLDLLCQRKQARNGTSKFNGNLPIKPPWRQRHQALELKCHQSCLQVGLCRTNWRKFKSMDSSLSMNILKLQLIEVRLRLIGYPLTLPK